MQEAVKRMKTPTEREAAKWAEEVADDNLYEYTVMLIGSECGKTSVLDVYCGDGYQVRVFGAFLGKGGRG